MNIGKFRHRIRILKKELVVDEIGDTVEKIIEVATLWAKVSNLHGREYFTALYVQREKTLIFTTRYKEGLDETMFLEFQGKDYDIKFIDNIKYKNEYLEIQALIKDS